MFPAVQFSQAKTGLSELMTAVVHSHRLEVIERHGGKEVAVLMAREDLLALLDGYRFSPRVALDGNEATAALEDFGILGFGETSEEAMEDLVVELRAYSQRVLVDDRDFYAQTDRASHVPWLLRFALTRPEDQIELLYADSRTEVEALGANEVETAA